MIALRQATDNAEPYELDDASSGDDLPSDFANRVALQAQITWSGLQDGYSAAGTSDSATPYSLLYWNLGPVKTQHCFPGGTLIATPDGERPIETICVGDLVQTMHGARRVTRLYRDLHFGELVHIEAAGHAVDCTPNHPFLTRRGWIPAGELRADDAVFLQDGPHVFPAHVRLPDAHYGVATGSQVGILGAISALLRQLPLLQWLKAWMSMPVVSVGLDDQRADPDVYDELLLDESRWLERDAETLQDSTQIPLKFARLVALELLMSDAQPPIGVRHFLWMRRAPRLDLGLHFRTLHRVVFEHVRSRLAVNDLMLGLLREDEAKSAGFVANLHQRIAECYANFSSAVGRVVRAQVGDLLWSPQSFARLAMQSSSEATAATALGTQRLDSIPNMPTLWADLHLTRLIDWPAGSSAQVAIPTGDTAKAVNTIPGSMLVERHSTLFTKVLPRHNGTPPVLDSSIPHSTVVFNLEVEGVHQYVANGFVVHNCGDCPTLAMNSPYDPPWAGVGSNQLNQTPGDGQTECGAGCKCSLDYSAPAEGSAALAELNAAKAQQWQDFMSFDGSPLPAITQAGVPGAPAGAPTQARVFTPLQKSHMDTHRNLAEQWNEARGNLPEAPDMFRRPDISGAPRTPWGALTPYQQGILDRMTQNEIDWLHAVGQLNWPTPPYEPDIETKFAGWMKQAAAGTFTPWWKDYTELPAQEQELAAWLDEVAHSNRWPTPPPLDDDAAMRAWMAKVAGSIEWPPDSSQFSELELEGVGV